MCGISGIFRNGSGDSSAMEDCIARMSSTLTHRGPDASDIWVDRRAGIAFGHRRLSVLDLTSGRCATDAQRLRALYGYFQWRNLQSFGDPFRARGSGQGAKLEGTFRHRDVALCHQVLGDRGCAAAVQRDVRICDLGCARREIDALSRSIRRKTPVLRVDRFRSCVRLRTQGVCSSPALGRDGRPQFAHVLHAIFLCPIAADDLGGKSGNSTRAQASRFRAKSNLSVCRRPSPIGRCVDASWPGRATGSATPRKVRPNSNDCCPRPSGANYSPMCPWERFYPGASIPRRSSP